MDVRDVLIDGTQQLYEWLDSTIEPLTAEQVNFAPGGMAVSIGFHAWHITRTADNVCNFVFQGKTPLWLRENYMERFGLPKVEQGTGMALETAQALHVNDPALLREYGRRVGDETLEFIRNVPDDQLMEVQLLKPLGEMPKWRALRQVIMTHGFMHLGEINTLKGLQGLQFFL